jgi:hypothetical protein
VVTIQAAAVVAVEIQPVAAVAEPAVATARGRVDQTPDLSAVAVVAVRVV